MIPTITDEQMSAFHTQGYVLLDAVFTRGEMEELAGHIEGFVERHEKALRAKGGTEGISRAGEIAFTAFLAEQDENIRDFTKRPEFVAIATRMLGPDIDLYWNQSVFKGPEGTKEFPWHQDDGYTPVDPSPYLTLWLAVNDATEENGCISVLPGSHKQGLVEHKPSPIGLVCYDPDAPDQGVRVPVPAGSIAAFTSLTFHKSGPNHTDGWRKAYVIQYSKAGLKNAKTGELMENKIPIARNGQAV